MTTRTIIILWAIVAVLAITVAAVRFSQNDGGGSATQREPGDTLFASFPAEKVAAIEITGAEDSVNLAQRDGTWIVTDRDDFPANARIVNDFIRTMAELKVTQGIEAGPTFAPRFGMDPEATTEEDRGLTIAFRDSGGEEFATVSLGKNLESAAASASPFGGGATGRFVRNHADESGFYAVSEVFGAVTATPREWLSTDFLRVEKIQEISVTGPGSDTADWTVSRDNEDGDFVLEDLAVTESMKPEAIAPLKSLFSFARFEDLVPSGEAESRGDQEQTRVATIRTFEGITYTVRITPEPPAEEAPATDADGNPTPPADPSYLMSFTVEGELPAERKKEEGESEEDAAARDKAFTERRDTLAKRLEQEKALAGRTFEVTKWTVDALIKDRAELVQPATQEATPQSATPQPGTGGGISAVTPPIAIPPLEETDTDDTTDDQD